MHISLQLILNFKLENFARKTTSMIVEASTAAFHSPLLRLCFHTESKKKKDEYKTEKNQVCGEQYERHKYTAQKVIIYGKCCISFFKILQS